MLCGKVMYLDSITKQVIVLPKVLKKKGMVLSSMILLGAPLGAPLRNSDHSNGHK